MSQEVVLENLNTAYAGTEQALIKAKRAALEYEVFMSNRNHQIGDSVVVEDIDAYFSNLIRDEENSN